MPKSKQRGVTVLMTPEELRRKLIRQSSDPRTRRIVPIIASVDPRTRRYGAIGWKDYVTAPLKAALIPVHMVYSGGKWVVDKIWENPKAAAAIALGAAGIWGLSRGYHAPAEFLDKYPNASDAISAIKEGYNSVGNARDMFMGAGSSALHGAYAVGDLVRLRPKAAAGHAIRSLKGVARAAKGAAKSVEAGAAATGRLWRLARTGLDNLSPMWEAGRGASDYANITAENAASYIPPNETLADAAAGYPLDQGYEMPLSRAKVRALMLGLGLGLVGTSMGMSHAQKK